MKEPITDPYSLDEKGDLFADYFNEYGGYVSAIHTNDYTDVNIVAELARRPLTNVDVRFARYFKDFPEDEEALKNHPVKVAHINEMAKRANACTSIVELKPILNEVHRLIYGKKHKLPFPEKESDPELVSIKE